MQRVWGRDLLGDDGGRETDAMQSRRGAALGNMSPGEAVQEGAPMIPWGWMIAAFIAGLCIGVGMVGWFDIPGRADDIHEAWADGYRKGVAYCEGTDAREKSDGK